MSDLTEKILNEKGGEKKAGKKQRAKTNGEAPALPAPKPAGEYDETLLFWDEWDNPEKPDKDGNPKKEYKYSYQRGCRFLMNNGFGKLKLENNNYKFVRMRENIVEEVTPRIMKEFMLGYLNRGIEKNEEGKYTAEMDELYLVREMFQKGSKTYCSEEKFEALDYLTITFKTDTADTVFLYFKNCFVEIKADGITRKEYKQLDGAIWKKQITSFEFNPEEAEKTMRSEFNRFLKLAVCGAVEKTTTEGTVLEIPGDERAQTKYKAAKSALGYGISRYKNRAVAKAIVCVDKKLRHGGNESNGGSGKGIFLNAISKVRNAISIDGKTFRFDATFPYTMISEDHEFVHFEDVKRNFDMEMLFNPITGNWEIRRLHENSYQILFERSAKIGISTNFSLKGTGSSFFRRQHIIEFSNFFHDKNTPLDYFGHLLFDNWDETEWNYFYNFIIVCVQEFLKNGLTEFPLENYGTNKLVDAAGEEFIDWMDEHFGFIMDEEGHVTRDENSQLAMCKLETWLERDTIFQAFKNAHPNNKRYASQDRSNTFTGWVKLWCEQRGLKFLHKKDGSKYRWWVG